MIKQSRFWVFIQKIEIRILKSYPQSHVYCSIIPNS